jgi:hypothetical protein
MPGETALPMLEADLRILSSESRRSESLTGQITGWLSGPEYPQIKESAERAMVKLRALGNTENPDAVQKYSKVDHNSFIYLENCSGCCAPHIEEFSQPCPRHLACT